MHLCYRKINLSLIKDVGIFMHIFLGGLLLWGRGARIATASKEEPWAGTT